MRALLSLTVVLAIAVPAGADECVPSTSNPEIASCIGPVRVGLVGECEYVDNDLCQLECTVSVWLYTESNGIDGLQRQDEVVDDTCGGLIPSDVIWT